MQHKPILKLGRVITLCVILTSMSPGCLVRSAATSLDLIQAKIDAGGSSATPSSNTFFDTCDGVNWKKNDQKAMLYDGDTIMDPSKCLCGKQRDGNSWNSNDINQEFLIALTQTIVVKTIILTNIPAHQADFKMEGSNSGTWTQLCPPTGTGKCIAGSNNFAGTSEVSPLSVSFDKLKLTFIQGSNFGLCEVWAYEFKNYAPLSSFTFKWDTSVMDSKSYAVNQASAPFTYMSSGEMLGVINTDGQFGYTHTCTWIKNTATNGNSVVLVTLPYYLEIKEIYHQGDFEVAYYLGDPVLSPINTGTATTINTAVESLASPDVGKFSKFTSAKVIANSKNTGVFSGICSEAECADFATNKIIITNKEQDKDFFICGFGIMGKIVPCPPTTNQCSHSQLLPTTSTIASVSVNVGSSVTTPSFSFPDALSNQCTTVFSQSGCTTGRTYSLTCFKCSACSLSGSCSGTCPAFSAVTFTNSFTSSGTSATLTVNPTNVADADFYSCKVSCVFNSITQLSNQFQLNICSSCANTILTNTATSITALTPSFPNKIAVGTTGATSSFTAPTNSVTLCSGVLCSGISYAIKCKDKSISGAVFATPSYISPVFDQTNPTTPTLKLSSTSPTNVQGIIWDCQVIATLGTSTLTSNTFTVQFDMCISAAESCPYGTLWQSPIIQNPSWVAPLDIIAYPNNVAASTTLDYSKWKDNFNNKCLTNFCGTPTYTFVNAGDFGPLPFAAAVTTSDNGSGTITFTVQTSNNNLAAVYYVGVKATLANDVTWVGTRPTNTWTQFIVTIINPCGPPVDCKYTKLIAPTVVQTPMTISVSGPSQSQSFPNLNDFVSVICNYVCNPAARSYALMYTSSNLQVPSDLATIDSTTLLINAQTSNWAYSGIHTVYVLATINLQFFYGTGTQSVKGNDFTITVDPCASCAKTTFIALGTGDTQPASYSIGVENTPGQTLFTPFQNQAAKYCLNPTLCGTPTYAIVCVSGCLSNQITPPFSQSITVDTSLKMKQSSWTTDYTLAGTYTVRIEATLVLSSFGQSTPITISTNNYVITINACVPIPCQYNKIIAPVITGGVNHLPQTQVVLCNNTVASDYFSAYTDMVSARCSSGGTYTDKCGPKNYVIENSPSGTALPFTVSITQSGTNTNQLTSIATSDCLLVNIYNVQIHASFATPTVTASDNTDVKFIISVEYPDPCNPIICAANTLSPFDPAKDKFPSDFSIWVNNTWGTTNFTNFRDSKSDKCAGLPGAWPNGTLVASFTAPICGYPTYQIKVVSSGANLDSVFGSSNVVLVQTGALDWQLQVRTSNKILAGVYEIQIVGTLLGVSLIQPSFKLTVLDECNPYNCSLTKFYPIPNGLKPTDITVKVGQGFVTSNQALWTDAITAKCSNAALGQLCGQTQFLLLLSDGSPVPFTYTVSQSSIQTQVSVEITDPLLIGTIFDVYLRGYGLDSNGLPFGLGTSSLFKITVIEADSTDYGSLTKSQNPQFDTFPEDQTFLTNTTYNSYTVEATASVQNGTIVSISASLGSATSFVSITNQTGQISFKITYNSQIPLGDYVIKVTAEDDKGAKVSKSFKITIKNPVSFVAPNLAVQQKQEMKQILEQMKSSNTTDTTPVTAEIESVSINGVVEIKFSAAVVPVSDVAQLSIEEVYLVYEQNSFEADQTFSFTWTVVKSTPFKLIIQLNFLQPLDISQGTFSDRIRVWLKRDILMIKDTIGMYRGWVDRYNSTQKTIIKANPLIQFEYQNVKEYWNMVKNIPQLVEDVPAGIFLVNYNLNNVQLVTQTMFWFPFVLQIAVPEAMEKTWLMFGSLQVFNMASQMNLKIPANVAGLAMYLQKTANSQFFDNYDLYGWLRSLASDRNVSNPTNSTQINSTSRILNATNSNTSESPQAKTTSFQDSKFYGHGSTEKVIESSAQMLIALFLVSMVFLSLMFFQKALMHWFPAKFKEAFHSIKRRFFFSLPLRILSQQYMQVSLGALINMKLNSDRQSTEQKVNYGISVTIIMFYSLLFPAWIIYFIRKHRQIVTTDHIFIKEWNTLFLKVDLRKYHALFLLAYNLIRRFLLMYVAVSIKFPLLQLISVLYIQTTFTLYVMVVWPMEDTVDNQSLIFNELILTTICVILFSFTQYVPDSKIRYQLGWITIYFVYLLILVTSGVWAVDFYKMLRRQFLILRQKRRLLQRKQKAVQHNKIVDEIGRHRPQENNIMFKRRNALVDEQLEDIESLGDQEMSDQVNVSVADDAHDQTIAARKLEFQQQMADMKRRNDFDEDVKVQQVLNNLPPENTKKQEKKRMPSFFDDIFKDLIPEPLSRRKIQQQVQQQSDWPVSPRHAHVLKKMEIPIERQEQWSWDNEVQGSNISQWNALPDDFSHQNSDKSWGEDEFKPKNNHVGKIQKLNQEKERNSKNQWISSDSEEVDQSGRNQ